MKAAVKEVGVAVGVMLAVAVAVAGAVAVVVGVVVGGRIACVTALHANRDKIRNPKAIRFMFMFSFDSIKINSSRRLRRSLPHTLEKFGERLKFRHRHSQVFYVCLIVLKDAYPSLDETCTTTELFP